MSGVSVVAAGRWCGCGAGAGRLPVAVEAAAGQLGRVAPELVAGFRAAVPWAARVVGGRLVDALCREDVSGARDRFSSGRWHGFDRFAAYGWSGDDPVDVLPVSVWDRRGWALAAELTNAVVNLAVAAARPPVPVAGWSTAAVGEVDGWVAGVERAAALRGHNLHPCGRTRLGWSVADVLAHDVESPGTGVGFVAVRADLCVGDDVSGLLARWYPQVPVAPPGWVVRPVHVWQWAAVLRDRYADLVRAGVMRVLPQVLPAVPTAAVRTVLLPAGADGRRRYLKVSLDIQVTSTRRTISVASTRNGPVLSRVLAGLVAGDEVAAARLVLLPEVAGAAVRVGSGRDVSVIVRDGLAGVVGAGEVPVSGVALATAGVLSARVDEFARVRGLADRPAAALAFVGAYAGVVLPPLLRLATRFGVALEAHLQNCLPTFRGGVPYRLVVRDFAGLRLLRSRLAAAGVVVELAPGSVVVTDDPRVMRAKVGYTALQAHVGEVVVGLVGSHGLDEAAGWRAVRAVVDEVYDGLRSDPGCAGWAAEDHAALTAPMVAHKALVRMRLAGSGDVYVPVRNPIADGGFTGASPSSGVRRW
ncbi:IucA/IucC family protein [Solwaraspora sp. WMMD406]|uniref:IucA/IucC family protein n=1 Tax=Solwaraspora sp. WMMD406 TaxID=3016095 RepID=UPI002416BAE2|nr:IucA/IucC family protein [Solwaraspora sp. WMMD406]MDG4766133.1 IucA/IucC family protein [Solwaraspora sp. WMMD406]